MSKRNFILIVIVLIIIVAVVFGFFYFYQPKSPGVVSDTVNFLADFMPFGKSKTTTPTDINQPVDVSGFVPTSDETQNIKLKKISTFPIAGYGVYMKERYKDVTNSNQTTETPLPNLPLSKGEEKGGGLITSPSEFASALRYVNKATGNIYQTFADRIDERRFSSTVIPKVYEAFFGNEGNSVVMRYLKTDLPTGQAGNKTIETFVGAVPKESLGVDLIAASEVKGSFLPENVSDISVAPDASKIFYLFNIADSAVGITLTLSTNTKVQVLDSPFTEWLSFWPNSKMITVTTKPSANVPGFMYAINPDKKDFNKILGGINGLTTLTSPDGKMVLYGDNNLSLSIFNIGTGNSISIGVNTLPEKCVWGTVSDIIYCAVPKFIDRAQHPDSWYQGEVSFSDEIWKIDAISGNTAMILDLVSISGEEVDGIKLTLDEGQNYLFFVNKKDSYLWELNLR